MTEIDPKVVWAEPPQLLDVTKADGSNASVSILRDLGGERASPPSRAREKCAVMWILGGAILTLGVAGGIFVRGSTSALFEGCEMHASAPAGSGLGVVVRPDGKRATNSGEVVGGDGGKREKLESSLAFTPGNGAAPAGAVIRIMDATKKNMDSMEMPSPSMENKAKAGSVAAPDRPVFQATVCATGGHSCSTSQRPEEMGSRRSSVRRPTTTPRSPVVENESTSTQKPKVELRASERDVDIITAIVK